MVPLSLAGLCAVLIVDTSMAARAGRPPALLLLASTIGLAVGLVALFVAVMASLDDQARGVGQLWWIAVAILATAVGAYLVARRLERRAEGADGAQA